MLSRAYTLLAGLYLVTLLALTVAAHVTHKPEIRGVLRTGRALLFLPAPVLWLPALALERWTMALFLLPLAIALIPSWGALLRPRGGGERPARGATLTVLTYNLQAPHEEEAPHRAALIREIGADIVALQELSSEAAAHLASALSDIYPHQALYPQPNRYAGQGLLSRYPIVTDEFWQCDEIPEPLGHQRAELDVSGTRVTLYNAHPVPPFSLQERLRLHPHSVDMTALLERVRTEQGGAVIVAGDLNMTAQFEEYRRLAEMMVDAYVESGRNGPGFTFPVNPRIPPLARLDHIFCRGDLLPLEARPLRHSGGSDHRPVWARLALTGEENS